MARRGMAEAPASYTVSEKALNRIRDLSPNQPVTVKAKIIQSLLDRAEMTEDLRAFDAAKAAGGALIPTEVMDRIWDGDARVKVFREWRGMKQGELAKASGLSQAYLCEIEKGKNLSSRAAKALARALDIDVGDLLVDGA